MENLYEPKTTESSALFLAVKESSHGLGTRPFNRRRMIGQLYSDALQHRIVRTTRASRMNGSWRVVRSRTTN